MKRTSWNWVKAVLCILLMFLLPYLAVLILPVGQKAFYDIYLHAQDPLFDLYEEYGWYTLMFLRGCFLLLPGLMMFAVVCCNSWMRKSYRFGWCAALLVFILQHLLFIFGPKEALVEGMSAFWQLFVDSAVYSLYIGAIIFVVGTDLIYLFRSRRAKGRALQAEEGEREGDCPADLPEENE